MRLVPTLIIVGAAMALGLWQGIAVVFAMRNDGSSVPWREPIAWEMTSAVAATLCILIPMTAVLNAPRPATAWVRFVATHIAAFVVYWAVKLPLMLCARYALYTLLGWGSYDYSFWPGHLAMEAMKDAIGYAVIATAYALYDASRERQERTLREAQLVSELRESRLQALQAQLDPHFLMNTLNTISSVMFEDLGRSDRLLADLGAILRAGFDGDRRTWTLANEHEHTARFAALLEARFADRLVIKWDLPAELARTTVPRFALQLLVENAIKHNQDRVSPLCIRIAARRIDDALELVVDDDGRGFGEPSPATGAGRGLRHLVEVLELLHGSRGSLSREVSPAEGARVRVRLPAEHT